jgi:hypothetical protein
MAGIRFPTAAEDNETLRTAGRMHKGIIETRESSVVQSMKIKVTIDICESDNDIASMVNN